MHYFLIKYSLLKSKFLEKRRTCVYLGVNSNRKRQTSMTTLPLSDLTFKDLEKAIDQYLSLDFRNSSIADADKLFRQIIKHFVTQTMVWREPIIYRARRHNSGKALFDNAEELIYPKNATTLGRLNEIGESIFYGASHRDTALLEMRPKLGEEFTILESRLKDIEKAPKFMEVGIRELMTNQNHSTDFIKQNREMLDKALVNEENKKRNRLINDFLIKEMTKVVKDGEIYNYKGTIAIGQFFIKSNPFADGLLYPSINRNGAECVAIKPDSYDRFYRPDRCFKIKIVNIVAKGIPTAYCIDNSTNVDVNGHITWT